MKTRRLAANAAAAIVMLAVFAALSGCAALPTIVPLPNSDVADLSSDDVVRVMHRVGYDREQILERGVELRNAIALNGAARVVHSDRTETLLAVHNRCLYICSRTRGAFIYDLDACAFR